MSVSASETPWLLLTFSLPNKRASARVKVWRLLQRYGTVPLGNSGYLLPNGFSNQERFEWLATAIRQYGGEASIVRVQSIDNLATPQLVGRFAEARAREYQQLIRDLQEFSSASPAKRRPSDLTRLRARFREIAEVDFFQIPLQKRVEELLARADTPARPGKKAVEVNPRDYTGRIWVTRPRPGIDRSASAWLIRRFIDKKAKFTFAKEGDVPSEAVPFDMFRISSGFGHRGEDCSFETLQRSFRIRDSRVTVIAQIIHDADILDEKFGRKEGFGLDEVLKGWARKGMPDKELLDRGIALIEGLYNSLA